MTARPARHRTDASAEASTFWAARELLADAAPGGRPRHARKVTSKYATHVGRVGALAVSLGIGIAVVNSATPAYAETDTDSGTSSASSSSSSSASTSESSVSTSESASTESSTSSRPSVRTGTRAERAEARSQGALGSSDVDEADEVEVDDSEDLTSSVDDSVEPTTSGKSTSAGTDVADVDPTPADDQNDDTAPVIDVDTADPSATDDGTTTTTTTTSAATTTVTTTMSGRAAARAAVSKTVEPETQTQELTETNVFGAVMSTALGGVLDTDAPVSNPINDAIFAYVRRLINHTFFNKAPVVRDVTTTQVLNTVVIDIDAYDPNGDPLTYDIIQPEGGIVVQVPFTSKFIYTPGLPVMGDPKTVEFQIVVRDDSEHLTGALGAIQTLLHDVARYFGLAETDNVTQTVSFEMKPLLDLPPGLIAVGNILPYQLGSDPIALLTGATIEDLDSDTLKRVEVKFAAGDVAGDALHFVDTEDIKGSWNPESKTLTLSGDASPAAYEAALKSVTFSATSVGLVGRIVAITLVDEHDNKSLPFPVTVTVIPAVLKAPGLVALPGLPYRIGDAPGRVLSVAEIVDPDSANLKRVVLEIIGGLRAGDVLGYIQPEDSNIKPTWDADAGTLTLEGVASIAAYEAALKAVTFKATELGPLSRTITIKLVDEDGTEGLLDTPVILGVFAAPELPLAIVPGVGLPTYTIGKPAVRLLSSVSIHNADDDTLTGATVTIAIARLSGDKLVFTGAQVGNIQVTQTNDYTLKLSGVGSVAEYEQAFKQIAFSATELGLPRTVTFTAVESDGDDTPVPAPLVVTVLPAVAPTVVAPSLGIPVYTIGKRGVVLAPTVLIGDLDSTHLTKATMKITVNKEAGDKLSYTRIDGNPITASWDGTTLTLQGTATIDQYRAALESVTFETTEGAGLLNTRMVEIHVWDDSNVRSLVHASGEVMVKNPDRPSIVTLGLSGLVLPNVGETVKPITSATIIDPDSTVLYGASVKITNNYVNGDTLAFATIAGNPVTATFNSATRELTLSGTATLAQYKQALQNVTFKANSYGGGTFSISHTRTLTIQVKDDSNLEAALPGTVLVTIYR
ncbi:hypothetical protein ACAG25_18880 [Mycobacterium sp. pV006]|uniref:hypothetical protein n=1 Tax=Mycobacterium sp. pV006 TaxID=3238983 RepID=UPI00351BBB73